MCSAADSKVLRPLERMRSPRRGAHGVTLIEVIVFILIVSLAVVAIVNLLGMSTANSADPLVYRQNLAVGESLVQEIDAIAYHQKDPYNPSGANDAIGPEAGEARSGSVLPFDNPNDYSGYAETGITTPDGTAISALSTYSASVLASQQAMGNIPASDGLLVAVKVTGPNGQPVIIYSFRAMYAP
jgi:MSHA pilin protein MshD